MRLGLPVALMLMLALASAGEVLASPSQRTLTLAADGRSGYRIVIAEEATATERKAAQELRSFLRQISGAVLPIVSDDLPAVDREIVVGHSDRLRQTGTRVDWRKLGGQGFTIRTVGPRLVIAGGPEQGTLYGVYTLLEDYLGCRWYTPSVSVVPRTPTIEIGQINDTQVPALSYRNLFYCESWDMVFAIRQKTNGTNVDATRNQIAGAHTFFTLPLLPESYFASHPEYFAFRDGRRMTTQPCLTNPDVLRIVKENLRKLIVAAPEQKYWSVSQMDNGGYCTCDQCRAVDDREGTPMGSVLEFVNKVAADFPKTRISTLAYAYTRKPPKTLKPAKNVSIVLCSIECNRSRPIATDAESAGFRDDVVKWAEIEPDICVWDYVVQFTNYLDPFPNLRVLQPNIQFFVAHHARGMFSQGDAFSGGEFAELRSYMLAKLMWDPDCDINAVMNDFLRGYYGPASGFIRTYIDELHDALAASGKVLSIYGQPDDHRDGCLSADKVARYEALFDQAEEAVAADPELLQRVQRARVPIMFARLRLGYGDVASRFALLNRMEDICKQSGIERFVEWGMPREEFIERTTAGLLEEKAAARPAGG